MRKIVNSTFVSLDGVINHMEAWHFTYSDGDAERVATEHLMAADALLMGRKTYEVYAGSWPNRDGDYADKINSMQKYVVSGTLDKADWANTSILSGNVVEEIADLKSQPGGDIVMHGYGPVAKALVRDNLLDVLHLWVHPALAGVGTLEEDMVFADGLNVPFKLLGTRTLDSGIVILTYSCVR
ncbi:dihydrofolate reductase family protein [Plantactinospora sp. GCM10030261]|uniref:dihydrofolate reductase family protein n=1 Tax=Plantactinospora sp. GCM10030261 TaxID=3273420 RepID=UPI003619D0F5